MPSERFLNLPEEKRQRVLRAGVEEFSRVPFDQVSINKIIRAAGIPRGSFYQYFEDKQDLLEFIMRGYATGLREKVRRVLAQEGNVFSAFVCALDYTIDLASRTQNSAFFHNVFSSARQCDAERFSFSAAQAAQLFAMYGPLINRSAFVRADDAFVVETLDILIMLLRQTIARLFAEEGSTEEIRQGFMRKLDIVQRGALRQGGAA